MKQIFRLTVILRPILAAFVVVATWASPALAVDVERVVSEKGIEAWLVRDPSNPITTIKVTFRGGAALDPDGKDGLARLAAATLDEGAGDLDSTAFQTALDEQSISLSFRSGLDSFRATVRTLNTHRDDAFKYLRLALTEPRFDEEPVERMRAQLLSSIRQNQESPQFRASRAMFEQAFAGHPYARSGDGSLDGMASVTRDDLRTFVKQRLARSNLVIGVVGDIDAPTLKRYLDDVFAALPATASGIDVSPITPKLSGGVRVIDVDVPQSSIQFGQPGMLRSDPDFYTAYVLNYVIGGGGFVSRLYEEVREKRGLAYSVYSYLMPLQAGAAVMGGAGTANERVAETIQTVRDVWQGFAANGPTEEELNNAKTYLTGAFALRFTSSETIASMLVSMQVDDLGIDYIDKRNSYIEAVTMADAQRVAKSLYQPENLSFVVAGKPVGVTATE